MFSKTRSLYPRKLQHLKRSTVKGQCKKSLKSYQKVIRTSGTIVDNAPSNILKNTKDIKSKVFTQSQRATLENKRKLKRPRTAKVVQLEEVKEEVQEEDLLDEEEAEKLQTNYHINVRNLMKATEALITFTSNNPKLQNQLFDDVHFPVFVQVNTIKVPKTHSRIIRIPLKHSLHSADSEVCLIVPDVKGIPNKKHEEHLERYESLLTKKGVNNIKKIMTFHEFRTEYETFELRSRLVELYDVFLVDGKISGKTVKICGKIFYQKRKVPTSIKLHVTKLKEHIDQTLRKTPLYYHTKSDSFIVQVGHSKMAPSQLVENVFYMLEGLEKNLPGGFGNIRNLNLHTFRGLSIPIYTTFKSTNAVQISKNLPTPKPVDTFTGELSTKLNSGVTVTSTGEVTVYRLKERKRKSSELNQSNNKKQKVEQQINKLDSLKENQYVNNKMKTNQKSKATKVNATFKKIKKTNKSNSTKVTIQSSVCDEIPEMVQVAIKQHPLKVKVVNKKLQNRMKIGEKEGLPKASDIKLKLSSEFQNEGVVELPENSIITESIMQADVSQNNKNKETFKDEIKNETECNIAIQMTKQLKKERLKLSKKSVNKQTLKNPKLLKRSEVRSSYFQNKGRIVESLQEKTIITENTIKQTDVSQNSKNKVLKDKIKGEAGSHITIQDRRQLKKEHLKLNKKSVDKQTVKNPKLLKRSEVLSSNFQNKGRIVESLQEKTIITENIIKQADVSQNSKNKETLKNEIKSAAGSHITIQDRKQLKKEHVKLKSVDKQTVNNPKGLQRSQGANLEEKIENTTEKSPKANQIFMQSGFF